MTSTTSTTVCYVHCFNQNADFTGIHRAWPLSRYGQSVPGTERFIRPSVGLCPPLSSFFADLHVDWSLMQCDAAIQQWKKMAANFESGDMPDYPLLLAVEKNGLTNSLVKGSGNYLFVLQMYSHWAVNEWMSKEYACWKKCVLRIWWESGSLIGGGRVFFRLGAEWLKAHDPSVIKRTGGGTS